MILRGLQYGDIETEAHFRCVMHIAMVSGEYPPRWGGIGSVVFHLAGHLAARGHRVSIITRTHKDRAPPQQGVSVIEVPWLKAPMAFTRSYGKHALLALKHLHSREPVDAIHIHLPLASFTRKEFRFMEDHIAPVCSSLHGSWLGEKQGVIRAAKAKESATWRNPNDLAIRLTGKYYSKYERAGILESSVCVANSKSTLSEFEDWYEPSNDFRCEVVLWGCDHKVFRPPNQDDEEEQLSHEKLRKNYDCDDELALSYMPETKTPMILAVGRLVARMMTQTTGPGNYFRLKAIVIRKASDDDIYKRASLLQRDSVHGPFNGTVRVDENSNSLIINGNPVKVIYANDPSEVAYADYSINNPIVVDNTGVWRDEEGLSLHLKSGAKIIKTPEEIFKKAELIVKSPLIVALPVTSTPLAVTLSASVLFT